MTSLREALCVALDGSDRQWILDTAAALAEHVGWLKVGLEAYAAHGPGLVRDVAACGRPVFVDLKLHDIPTTVRRAAAASARTGAGALTVHASGGRAMLDGAVAGARDGAGERPPLVIAVTLMTSLDAASLAELGIGPDIREIVVRWARLAQSCGVDGVVASAREAPSIRAECGSDLLIVTPGIRPSWWEVDDQRRAETPAAAIRRGADVLVVGRPITRAPSPVDAARRILDEMAAGRS